VAEAVELTALAIQVQAALAVAVPPTHLMQPMEVMAEQI
jgi:hypothetical protein